MRTAPRLSGAGQAKQIVRAYSDNKELNAQEFYLLNVANSAPDFYKPKSVRQARAQIESARQARDHLLELGLSPILGSFSFEALRKGKK